MPTTSTRSSIPLLFLLLSLVTASPISHSSLTLWNPLQRHLCPVILQGDLGRILETEPALGSTASLHRATLPALRQDEADPDLDLVPEEDDDEEEEEPGVRAIEYMVALESSDEVKKFCSGSLISSKWLLTIASCAIDRTWIATIGGTLSDDGVIYAIQRVINHEKYDTEDPQSAFDIALVELVDEAPEDSSFVHIYDNATLPNAGSFAREISYSDFNENTDRVGLLQLDFPIYLPERCRKFYEVAEAATANISAENGFVCAGYGDISRCRVCTDRESQGGPLVQFDESGDIPIQIGITTFFSLELCFGNLPGVFLQVAPLVEWIESKNVNITKTKSSKLVYADGSSEVSELFDPDAGVLVIPDTGRGNSGNGKAWIKYLFLTIGIAIPFIIGASVFVRWRRRKVQEMAYLFAEPQPDSHVRSGSLMSDILEVHAKKKIRDSFSEDIEAADSADDDDQYVNSGGGYSTSTKPSDAAAERPKEKSKAERKTGKVKHEKKEERSEGKEKNEEQEEKQGEEGNGGEGENRAKEEENSEAERKIDDNS